MVTVSIMYPFKEGQRFDEAYYERTHMALADEIWGDAVAGKRILYAPERSGGEAPLYRTLLLVDFKSEAALQQALGSPRGGELQEDIPNFTDTAPQIQVNRAA